MGDDRAPPSDTEVVTVAGGRTQTAGARRQSRETQADPGWGLWLSLSQEGSFDTMLLLKTLPLGISNHLYNKAKYKIKNQQLPNKCLLNEEIQSTNVGLCRISSETKGKGSISHCFVNKNLLFAGPSVLESDSKLDLRFRT